MEYLYTIPYLFWLRARIMLGQEGCEELLACMTVYNDGHEPMFSHLSGARKKRTEKYWRKLKAIIDRQRA